MSKQVDEFARGMSDGIRKNFEKIHRQRPLDYSSIYETYREVTLKKQDLMHEALQALTKASKEDASKGADTLCKKASMNSCDNYLNPKTDYDQLLEWVPSHSSLITLQTHISFNGILMIPMSPEEKSKNIQRASDLLSNLIKTHATESPEVMRVIALFFDDYRRHPELAKAVITALESVEPCPVRAITCFAGSLLFSRAARPQTKEDLWRFLSAVKTDKDQSLIDIMSRSGKFFITEGDIEGKLYPKIKYIDLLSYIETIIAPHELQESMRAWGKHASRLESLSDDHSEKSNLKNHWYSVRYELASRPFDFHSNRTLAEVLINQWRLWRRDYDIDVLTKKDLDFCDEIAKSLIKQCDSALKQTTKLSLLTSERRSQIGAKAFRSQRRSQIGAKAFRIFRMEEQKTTYTVGARLLHEMRSMTLDAVASRATGLQRGLVQYGLLEVICCEILYKPHVFRFLMDTMTIEGMSDSDKKVIQKSLMDALIRMDIHPSKRAHPSVMILQSESFSIEQKNYLVRSMNKCKSSMHDFDADDRYFSEFIEAATRNAPVACMKATNLFRNHKKIIYRLMIAETTRPTVEKIMRFIHAFLLGNMTEMGTITNEEALLSQKILESSLFSLAAKSGLIRSIENVIKTASDLKLSDDFIHAASRHAPAACTRAPHLFREYKDLFDSLKLEQLMVGNFNQAKEYRHLLSFGYEANLKIKRAVMQILVVKNSMGRDIFNTVFSFLNRPILSLYSQLAKDMPAYQTPFQGKPLYPHELRMLTDLKSKIRRFTPEEKKSAIALCLMSGLSVSHEDEPGNWFMQNLYTVVRSLKQLRIDPAVTEKVINSLFHQFAPQFDLDKWKLGKTPPDATEWAFRQHILGLNHSQMRSLTEKEREAVNKLMAVYRISPDIKFGKSHTHHRLQDSGPSL